MAFLEKRGKKTHIKHYFNVFSYNNENIPTAHERSLVQTYVNLISRISMFLKNLKRSRSYDFIFINLVKQKRNHLRVDVTFKLIHLPNNP